MTDNRTTEKKSPLEAKGDCTICKGWVDDGRGGTCVFADDYWSPQCPYYEQAIAATLGRGTCENTNTDGYGFCFECGAKVVNADD